MNIPENGRRGRQTLPMALELVVMAKWWLSMAGGFWVTSSSYNLITMSSARSLLTLAIIFILLVILILFCLNHQEGNERNHRFLPSHHFNRAETDLDGIRSGRLFIDEITCMSHQPTDSMLKLCKENKNDDATCLVIQSFYYCSQWSTPDEDGNSIRSEKEGRILSPTQREKGLLEFPGMRTFFLCLPTNELESPFDRRIVGTEDPHSDEGEEGNGCSHPYYYWGILLLLESLMFADCLSSSITI